MKLILAIVQDKDASALAREFVQKGVRATNLASSGGFLREGNTTFIIGIDDEKVDDVISIIKKLSHTREQYVSPNMNMDAAGTSMISQPVKVTVGGATVFVLPVEAFEHF